MRSQCMYIASWCRVGAWQMPQSCVQGALQAVLLMHDRSWQMPQTWLQSEAFGACHVSQHCRLDWKRLTTSGSAIHANTVPLWKCKPWAWTAGNASYI